MCGDIRNSHWRFLIIRSWMTSDSYGKACGSLFSMRQPLFACWECCLAMIKRVDFLSRTVLVYMTCLNPSPISSMDTRASDLYLVDFKLGHCLLLGWTLWVLYWLYEHLHPSLPSDQLVFSFPLCSLGSSSPKKPPSGENPTLSMFIKETDQIKKKCKPGLGWSLVIVSLHGLRIWCQCCQKEKKKKKKQILPSNDTLSKKSYEKQKFFWAVSRGLLFSKRLIYIFHN